MSGKAPDWLACYLNFLFIYQLQLLWTQASPEGMYTNETQVPWEIPSLPSPKTRKGSPHHRCCDWWMNLRIMAPRKTSAPVDSSLKHWYVNIFRLSSMWSLLHWLWLHVYSAEKDVKRRRSRIDPDEHVIFIYDDAPARRNPANPGPNSELKMLPPYSGEQTSEPNSSLKWNFIFWYWTA